MKRSEINQILREAKEFLASRQFVLPEWAEWSLQDWKANRQKVNYIVDRMLGWDITDFGSGDFLRCGLFLFTIRNGKYGVDDYDCRGEPGDAYALPLVQDGGHHQSRRRKLGD